MTASRIRAAVTCFMELMPEDVRTGRNSRARLARQIMMYLIRCHLGWSYPDIGNYLSCDHTTVIHGAEKIEGLLNVDHHSVRIIKVIDTFLTHRVCPYCHRKITGANAW
jgi:chromosomal replication initiation ATPase DnaA